tara:strand:- start:7805 stop:8659 length:855 start_codon:yes stop_codon:yes gene_type:complete
MSNKNIYYNLLEINETDNIDLIKKAYRKLSLKYHPDKNINNKQQYDKITNAYEIIISNISKDNINNELILYNNYPNNNIQNSNFQNNNFQNNNIETSNFQNNNYDTIYNKFKEDIIINMEITFEQAFNGSNIPIIIERNIMYNNLLKQEKETLYVEIPKGIDNDEIIIIENKGNIINNFKSDVKIHTFLLKHEFYTRNGLDIYYNINITFKESLIGFEYNFKYLNNKIYKIVNKDNIIHNNSKKIINNIGFIRNNYSGNLIIKFNINYPEKLSKEVQETLKNIL